MKRHVQWLYLSLFMLIPFLSNTMNEESSQSEESELVLSEEPDASSLIYNEQLKSFCLKTLKDSIKLYISKKFNLNSFLISTFDDLYHTVINKKELKKLLVSIPASCLTDLLNSMRAHLLFIIIFEELLGKLELHNPEAGTWQELKRNVFTRLFLNQLNYMNKF